MLIRLLDVARVNEIRRAKDQVPLKDVEVMLAAPSGFGSVNFDAKGEDVTITWRRQSLLRTEVQDRSTARETYRKLVACGYEVF
jgi:hypothetical protein